MTAQPEIGIPLQPNDKVLVKRRGTDDLARTQPGVHFVTLALAEGQPSRGAGVLDLHEPCRPIEKQLSSIEHQ